MNRLLAFGVAMALASPAVAETLRDAVVAAYASNPTLAAARARQDALAEAPEQARAAGRLTAAFDGAGGYDRFAYDKGVSAVAGAQLPIWTGGRVPSAVRAADSDVAAGAEGLRDTAAAVLEEVVGAYADLLYDQESVAVAQADIELLDHQVADSRLRFKLGNATRTDVARLEAQRDSAAATLAGAQAAVAADAARFLALTGHSPAQLAAAPETFAALPGTLDQARMRALAANPLLNQSQRTADAEAARIDQARANGNPSVTLGAAYGRAFDLGRATGSGYPLVANAGLTLHVPVLTGGLVASQVRAARAQQRAAVADVDAAAREAVRTAEAAWATLAGAVLQAKANASATVAADLALKGVRAEYVFGLRSTLDILVADENLRRAQLALARSRRDALIAQAGLLRATGRLDDSAFS